MDEDEYRLKKPVKQKVVDNLNIRAKGFSPVYRIYKAIGKLSPNEGYLLSEETFIDIIHAAYSEKKIINPVTPQEELRRYYDKLLSETAEWSKSCKYEQGIMVGIDTALRSVSQVHPDVKKWLKEGENDG
jgi:hypothetical protein